MIAPPEPDAPPPPPPDHNAPGLRLTVHFGERNRTGDLPLHEVLLTACERAGLRTCALLRGTEGFGLKHALRTDRLLTLSEDLPLVLDAVAEKNAIHALLAEARPHIGQGLLTLERAAIGTAGSPPLITPDLGDALKLTIYCGRHTTLGGYPAHRAITGALHRHRVAATTVLLGVDGVLDGRRRRARMVGRNVEVPTVVLAVGTRANMEPALAEIHALGPVPAITLERVTVLKQAGERLAPVPRLRETAPGSTMWCRLTVHAAGRARHGDHPVPTELVRRLREAGAPGATVLRGIHGFRHRRRPGGDRLLELRRSAPTITVILDEPDRAAQWFEIVDEVTGPGGVVTAELVPAARATAPGRELGPLAV